MVSSDNNKIDELLDAYLDQQLTEKERIQFEKSVNSRPDLAEQIELQADIDASLQRMFTPPAAPRLKLPSLASLQSSEDLSSDAEETSIVELPQPEVSDRKKLAPSTSGRSVSRRIVLTVLAAVAAVAWLYVGTELFTSPGRDAIAFHQRPLTEVYQECVDQGFMPYWVCDDEVTFANTFKNRQGVPLRLGDLPPTQQMVGLSYLPALSRNTTSMLALVDKKPVIVFVDRVENDWKPATGSFPDVGLTVTRTEKNGLVLYEVSPVEDSDVVQSLGFRNPT